MIKRIQVSRDRRVRRLKFESKYSPLVGVYIRRTIKNFYIQIKQNQKVLTEFNTLKLNTSKADKAVLIKESLSEYLSNHNIVKYHINIGYRSFRGHIKNILIKQNER